MDNNVFRLKFKKNEGGLTGLFLSGDPYRMNFCKKGRAFGAFKGFETKKLFRTPNGARVLSQRFSVAADTVFALEKDVLKVTSTIENAGNAPAYFKEGDLALYMPLNDRYEGSETCVKSRCSAHIFAGLDSAYIKAERMGISDYNLGMFMTRGSVSSYSQEKAWHSNRGFFLLNFSPFILLAGEKKVIRYEFFRYKDEKSFFEKLKTYDNYLHVETAGFTVEKGNTLSFSVISKSPIKEARFECGGKLLNCVTDGKKATASFKAEKAGDNTVFFTVDGRSSYACFNVRPDVETLVGKRLDFIVKNQQCLDEKSPLYGAFLIYDNEEKRQYFDKDWADYNASRERMGMAILLARWLKTHKNPLFEERLKLFTEFLLRENVEETTGEVFDGIGKERAYIRLYNSPWVALYFTELYRLTGDKRYASIVEKVIGYYYSIGGTKFYPNGIRFYDFFEILKETAEKSSLDKLLALFDEHAKNIVENGVIYPPHEVKFEQTIVAPAVTIMIDKYKISGDEFYLRQAEMHLKILRKFDGCQPDYHLHNIPVRFWDAYWFGKHKVYGDTFPHYWSVLSGYCYYMYGEVTGNAEAKAVGRECIENCTCLFNENGEASCAYLFPLYTDDVKGKYFDAFANDQDFALYFLLRTENE